MKQNMNDFGLNRRRIMENEIRIWYEERKHLSFASLGLCPVVHPTWRAGPSPWPTEVKTPPQSVSGERRSNPVRPRHAPRDESLPRQSRPCMIWRHSDLLLWNWKSGASHPSLDCLRHLIRRETCRKLDKQVLGEDDESLEQLNVPWQIWLLWSMDVMLDLSAPNIVAIS